MPNALNIVFDYEFFIKWYIPIIYVIFFPQLFMHMWVQRQKYYKNYKAQKKIYFEELRKQREKESLIVPEKYK